MIKYEVYADYEVVIYNPDTPFLPTVNRIHKEEVFELNCVGEFGIHFSKHFPREMLFEGDIYIRRTVQFWEMS